MLFADELERIAADRGAHLLVLTGRSSDPRNAITSDNLRSWVPDLARRDVFMCASPRFQATAVEALRSAGVPRAHIHREEFVF